MTGSQGNSVAEDRLKAAQDFVAAHPDVTLLQSQYGNEARDAGQKTMENFLSAYPGPGFDATYSFNDEGALGAVQALKNANALDKVKVGAIDGDDGRDRCGRRRRPHHECGRRLCLRRIRARGAVRLPQRPPPKSRSVNIPLLGVTADNVQKYQDQVLNGMATYDFKAVSQTFTPTASTDDYADHAEVAPP